MKISRVLFVGFALMLVAVAAICSQPRRWHSWRRGSHAFSGVAFDLAPFTVSLLHEPKSHHLALCLYRHNREIFEINTYGTIVFGDHVTGMW